MGKEQGWVEAAQIAEIGEWLYLFVNWGECCRGLDSTYEVRIGRAKSIVGPFLDKDGAPMAMGGGSLFLETTGDLIGPGHMGFRKSNDGSLFGSFHFYDAKRDGLPWIGETKLSIKDGWPEIKNLLPIARPVSILSL
jgi:arabinan endo-1,5-alpha-L-arabinosidase